MSANTRNTINRRNFIRAAGAGVVAGAAVPAVMDLDYLRAAMANSNSATSAVRQFYASLNDQQLLTLCFPFDDGRRQRINANWHITEPIIGEDFYSDQQRELINQILRNITSEEGYERLVQQMDEDSGGVESYSVAIFGDPENGKFEWEMTGRHLTLRADGDSVDRTAFGGPLVYGHGEENPTENMYYNQTQQVNEVFKALDPKQAEVALLPKAPRETKVRIQGPEGEFAGIQVAGLSSDQQELVESTIKHLLAPYRAEDVNEVMSILKAGGGMDSLRMSFYEQGDLNEDRVWDMWRIEGPSFVWNFRGSPHVHAYINISELVDPRA
jgi:hypothetical protein